MLHGPDADSSGEFALFGEGVNPKKTTGGGGSRPHDCATKTKNRRRTGGLDKTQTRMRCVYNDRPNQKAEPNKVK
jgi:hypothetical protein